MSEKGEKTETLMIWFVFGKKKNTFWNNFIYNVECEFNTEQNIRIQEYIYTYSMQEISKDYK